MAFLHLYFVLCPNRLETGIQNEMIGGNSDLFRYSFVLSGEVVSPLSYGAREGNIRIGIAEVADNSNSFSGNSAKIEGASLVPIRCACSPCQGGVSFEQGWLFIAQVN